MVSLMLWRNLGNLPTLINVHEGTHGRRRVLQSPLQDLVAIWLPYLVLLAAVMVGACYLYDPTMRLLLYSALPGSYQNWWIFTILWVEEVRLLILASGTVVPVWQLQIIAFDLIHHSLQSLTNSMLLSR